MKVPEHVNGLISSVVGCTVVLKKAVRSFQFEQSQTAAQDLTVHSSYSL